MAERKPIAFLSYVRSDDHHDGGNISNLRRRLEGEIKMQLGKPFPIFQDRNDIEWGQHWKERITDSLLDVTFLIPIITPSLFNSPACREEIQTFSLKENEYGFNQLILPIYYVECEQLKADFPQEKDAIADIIRSRQWTDWRPHRFQSSSNLDVAVALEAMACQIKSAIRRLEDELDAELRSRKKTKQKTKAREVSAPRTSETKRPKKRKSIHLVPPTDPFSIDISEMREGGRPTPGVVKSFYSKPYYVYTREFDEVIHAVDLVSAEELSALYKVFSFQLSRRGLTEPGKTERFARDAAVTLLIDNSGSLRGEGIVNLACWATILMEWLEAGGG